MADGETHGALDRGADRTRPELGRPLADELPRQRLIDLYARRWHVAVTTVLAPGGFGKSRALAQAIRDNDEDPTGIDVHLQLRSTTGDADALADALMSSLGADEPVDGADPVDAIAAALASRAPTPICVALDDAHHLGDDGAHLLGRLLANLPTNAHLLLSGRRIPELPLARLQAEDQVAQIGADDLAFSTTEVDAMAAAHAVPSDDLDSLEGWPALVRLAIVAGRTGSERYLAEEVLATVPTAVRDALAIATVAGFADRELLDGLDDDVTPERLAETVPLVDLTDDGLVRPHDLWSAMLEDIAGPPPPPAIDRIARWHGAAGRHLEAITVASTHGRWDTARGLVLAALDGIDPPSTASSTRALLDCFPADQAEEPEMQLLTGMVLRYEHGIGQGDDEIAAAQATFEARGDVRGEARATIERSWRAWLAGDFATLIDAVGRTPRLIEGGADYLADLDTQAKAIAADLRGDFVAAYEHACTDLSDRVPPGLVEVFVRHRTTLAFLVGEGKAALDHGAALAERWPTPLNSLLQDMGRFAMGDPEAIIDGWAERRYWRSDDSGLDYYNAVFSVFIDACLGIEPELDRIPTIAWDRSRERIQLALCELSAAIMAGDTTTGGERFRATALEIGLDDPLVLGELRRYIVSAYTLVPEARERFDDPFLDPPLGPYHLERRDLARVLLALREGDAPDWSALPHPDTILTAMSLPWSVELACGLVADDEARALDLIEHLALRAGPAAHRWLRTYAGSEHHASDGARRLLAHVPAPPAARTEVVGFGGLEAVLDGEPIALTRGRVRQLLAMLVLRRSVERDVLVDLLWPDMDGARARRNLGVTVTYLRAAMEPERNKGEPPYHVRQRGDRLVLHTGDRLHVDLWEVEDALARARAARDRGDATAAIDAAAEAVARWRGPLLPELDGVDDLRPERAAIELSLKEAAVDVAEWRMAQGHHDEAIALAERVIDDDPYAERAHVVLIAAQLASGAGARAGDAAQRCVAMLEELGVEPAPSTRMVLRRARPDPR